MANIKSFLWTPTAAVQIVLGSNGSGKSCLLNELNVLPGKPAMFGPKGMKRVKVQFNEHIYTVTSDFTSGNKHSIVRDDGEGEDIINTGKMQATKVAELFGYTEKIHAILTGKVLFSQLTPERRRELLMSICPIDYTYAWSLFKDLSGQLRDVQGAIKLREVELSDLHGKLDDLNTEDVDPEAEIEILEADLIKTYRFTKDRPVGIIYELEEKLVDVEGHLENIRKRYYNLEDVNYLGEGFPTYNAIEHEIEQLVAEESATQTTINSTDRELVELQELTSGIHLDRDMGEIEADIAILELEIIPEAFPIPECNPTDVRSLEGQVQTAITGLANINTTDIHCYDQEVITKLRSDIDIG